ncbi:MAG: transglycosylase domain-containing protein [Minisyncoccia bacterium]
MRRTYRFAIAVLAVLILVVIFFYPLCRALGGAFAHSRDGAQIAAYPAELKAEVADRGGTYLSYADTPPCLVDALMSVEDKRFFSHGGIDPVAAVRVFFEEFQNDHLDHGGSTITQQLARAILGIPRGQSFGFGYIASELRIARGALILEHDFSKEEILELYLNSVYFGRGATGASAAAEDYFGMPLGALSTGQCAYLAGLPQAPTIFGQDPSGAVAESRYRHVIATMQRNGYLTPAQEATLDQETLFTSEPQY